MKCAKCQLEFCWICMGRFIRYRHDSPNDNNMCAATLWIYIFITAMSGLVIGRAVLIPFVDNLLTGFGTFLWGIVIVCWRSFAYILATRLV